jgi:hypothetical protein
MDFLDWLFMHLLLKPKTSVILFEKKLKAKRICSIGGQKGHLKQVPLNQDSIQIQAEK